MFVPSMEKDFLQNENFIFFVCNKLSQPLSPFSSPQFSSVISRNDSPAQRVKIFQLSSDVKMGIHL